MTSGTTKILLLLTLTTLLLQRVQGGEQFPLIKALNNSDVFYKQITRDIDHYYIDKEKREKIPGLLIYRYKTKKDDSIFTVAASLNISYEAIVTLNELDRPDNFPVGKIILLPNLPGIFVNENPRTDLEFLIASWRKKPEKAQEITITYPRKTNFFFLPGEKFHKVELSFFLGVMFRFPLPKGTITSYFGPRMQPFTGKKEFHEGIDIAAPEGTPILASRGGNVEKEGKDSICGNYILLIHESGYETKYCHLKKIFVSLHQTVRSGMIIGEVGTTGMSTGPHLHFEIRERGKARDPMLMLPIK